MVESDNKNQFFVKTNAFEMSVIKENWWERAQNAAVWTQFLFKLLHKIDVRNNLNK